VRKEARAINRIYFRGNPVDEFTLTPGEQFVIGGTTFALQDDGNQRQASCRRRKSN